MLPEFAPLSKGNIISRSSVSVTIMFLKEGRPSPTILADGKNIVGARAGGCLLLPDFGRGRLSRSDYVGGRRQNREKRRLAAAAT